MTIDEAIKHAEEVAEENQKVVDTGIVSDGVTIDMLYCDDTEVIEEHLANYQKCTEEYRQLAEWLKELKDLREIVRDYRFNKPNDAISREDTIKAIQDKAKRIKNLDTINGLCGAISILYESPSVHPKIKTNEWILVKDRLPDFTQTDMDGDFQVYKASKRVLLTLNCNRDYVFTGRYTTNFGWLDDNMHILDDVVAWMPLPEPYKESEG